MAKPRQHTQQHIEQVLEHISEGLSVRKSCEAVGISRALFLKLVDGDQYAREGRLR